MKYINVFEQIIDKTFRKHFNYIDDKFGGDITMENFIIKLVEKIALDVLVY